MRFLRLGLLGVILVSVLVPRVVVAAAHRVAVVEASTSKVPRGEVAGLRADVEDVVRSLGAEIVPFVEAKAAAGGDCNQPECTIAIHQATGATHVLRVESVFKKGAFTMQLQLWDARTGKTLSSDGKSCDICTLPDLHAALRDRVGALCSRVFEAEDAASAQPPPPPPPPPPPLPPPAAPEVTAPAPAPEPASPAGKRIGQVGGIALVVLGVAAAAYGGYLLHLNGQSACAAGETAANCTLRHTPGGAGAGFLAGGIGAALVGGVLFYSFTW
jgi:pyruvate/2-oxoglutarate dehydrogenase complex dihydrolipoamide acyltransferase (E2) component